MATYTSPAPFAIPASPNAATFQAAMKDLRDALVAMGLVQTADTGQYDVLTGSPATPVANTSYGFVFRFNDALQATAPVFIRIGLRTASSMTAPVYGWFFQVGEGSDGASNLTGRRSNQQFLPMTGTAGGVAFTSSGTTYASGNGSEMALSYHDLGNTISQSLYLAMERTRNAAGAYDGKGVLFTYMHPAGGSPGSFGATLSWPTPGDVSAGSIGERGFMYGLNTPYVAGTKGSLVNGNNVGPLPAVSGGLFYEYRQTHVGLFVNAADIGGAIGNVFTVPILGTNRNFRYLGSAYSMFFSNSNYGSTSGFAQGTAFGLAIMWE